MAVAVAVAAGVFAAALAVPAWWAGPDPDPLASIPPPAAAAERPEPPAQDRPAVPEGEPVTRPARIVIDAIGVDAPLSELSLAADDAIEVPDDASVAGWYTGGPRPGEEGPSVVLGHVDSSEGPGVFFELRRLEGGEVVTVLDAGGARHDFEVYHRARYAKDEFPSALVYGNTQGAELRLVTCGGEFDRSVRHYRDNVIVWARAVPS